MNIKRIIKESMGMAESTIPYSNAVIHEIDKQLKFYLSKKYPKKHSQAIEIPYRQLATYIDDITFEDFPVVRLVVMINFETMKNVESDENFAVGGGAWPVYSKGESVLMSHFINPEKLPISRERKDMIDKGFSGEIEFDIELHHGFDPRNDLNGLNREIRSVVLHEMMHLYEFYKNKATHNEVIFPEKSKLINKKKSSLQTGKANLIDTKLIGVPKWVTDKMKKLYESYYLSLPLEIRAKTQEFYPFVLDMEPEEFYQSYNGRLIDRLRNFDAENFYRQLLGEINLYFYNKNIPYNEELANSFIEQIRLRTIREYLKITERNYQIVDEKFIKKKSLKDLITYMGKQINKGGERLNKNLGRLYSLKAESNEH